MTKRHITNLIRALQDAQISDVTLGHLAAVATGQETRLKYSVATRRQPRCTEQARLRGHSRLIRYAT